MPDKNASSCQWVHLSEVSSFIEVTSAPKAVQCSLVASESISHGLALYPVRGCLHGAVPIGQTLVRQKVHTYDK